MVEHPPAWHHKRRRLAMRTNLTPSEMQRFWLKVDQRGGPGACHPWTAARDRGYGKFTIRGKGQFRAHRLAYELTIGPIPEGLNVLHHCDNPPCCNPAHLFLGTQQDNVNDMYAKGRGNCSTGERSWRAKLTANDVREIRRRFKLRDPKNGLKPLAREFHVDHTTIRAIVKRRSWKAL